MPSWMQYHRLETLSERNKRFLSAVLAWHCGIQTHLLPGYSFKLRVFKDCHGLFEFSFISAINSSSNNSCHEVAPQQIVSGTGKCWCGLRSCHLIFFFFFSGGMLMLAQIVPCKLLVFSIGMLDVLRKHAASLVCKQELCTLRTIRMV